MAVMATTPAIVTRSDAARLGLPRYFTGKACKRGHVAERRAFHGTCMACEIVRGGSLRTQAYKAEYRSKYPEKCRASHAKWRDENADKVRSDRALYYSENKAKVLASNAVWISKNPDKARKFIAAWKAVNQDKTAADSRNRRARIANAEGTHSADDASRIRKLQKDKCAMCCVRLRGKGHVDHIIAIVNGGSNWPRNLQILCETCNLSKSAKHPITFSQQRGLLI